MRRGLQEVRRLEWAVRRETGEPGQGLGGGDGLWFGEIETAPTQVEITPWRSFLGGWGPMIESVGFPVWGEIEGEAVQGSWEEIWLLTSL